ncbi:DASH complex subunit DAD2, putative [Talaromyces stipitatus ATCC 10500]|uniref:DASH complex subunit DAD2 n=1 Tax=Talaromyces stipitatus (strain ATCC 10500 / CBS 375.48 / QM 6759 / NRRL 1006) TaxID=441959 RepID=B8M799_TALSN|nr:DASH complex subunit DAD2, putative [Talaromyces stipitatus ATCC 10500]EED20319.1 DASH complex subunit DAD2, putative [Talaromyces stipitatus ATCC 10500]
MTHPTINASLRQSNAYPTTSQQAIALTMRIEAKKAELENLSQLRDLSSALASQMQALEAKLATLKDGTESIACVLANWQSVLQAINMATKKTATSVQGLATVENRPATLVRIPTATIDTLPDA